MPLLDIGLEVLYTKLNTAYKGPASITPGLPQNPVLLARRPGSLVDVLPLAAQLLSMIA